jgi:trans-aconitate 2-methyltransferase
MSKPRDWDAAAYERLSAPIEAMGRDVLSRLELAGDETVLDAGCGTGRVTAALVERLPRGHVIAVDGSPAMVEEARRRLPDSVDVRQADLLELVLDEPVDAIISTATFHWIRDHDRLFAQLREALVPGGRLVAQCGGAGNVEEIKDAGFELARRLRYTDVWCWSSRVDVDLEDPAGYLAAICLGSFLERLPEDLHDQFIDGAVGLLGAPMTIHYVRLNILARRPASD